MAKKPGTRAEFVLFDVFYEDGSQRSNRKVPSTVLGGLDGDAPARAVIEEQDRAIAEKSGLHAFPIRLSAATLGLPRCASERPRAAPNDAASMTCGGLRSAARRAWRSVSPAG